MLKGSEVLKIRKMFSTIFMLGICRVSSPIFMKFQGLFIIFVASLKATTTNF